MRALQKTAQSLERFCVQEATEKICLNLTGLELECTRLFTPKPQRYELLYLLR